MSEAEEFLKQYEVDDEDIIENLVRTLTDFKKWLATRQEKDNDSRLIHITSMVMDLQTQVRDHDKFIRGFDASRVEVNRRVDEMEGKMRKMEDLLKATANFSHEHREGSGDPTWNNLEKRVRELEERVQRHSDNEAGFMALLRRLSNDLVNVRVRG